MVSNVGFCSGFSNYKRNALSMISGDSTSLLLWLAAHCFGVVDGAGLLFMLLVRSKETKSLETESEARYQHS